MSAAGSPNTAAMGWLEPGGSRKDAVEFCKGYAQKWMNAPEACFYAVLPFMGGFLWEVQEYGGGLSYLPETAKCLSDPAGPRGWFRVGKRVFQVSMRDGRPSLVQLTNEMSKPIIEAGLGEMSPHGRMTRVIRRGEAMLAFGVATFGTGTTFLALAYAYSFAIMAYAPEARRLDQDLLPHRQWSRVERVPPQLYVETMKFSNQQWTTNVKPVMRSGSAGSQSGASVQRAASAPAPLPAPARPPENRP